MSLVRPCSHPGCPVLVTHGRCSVHKTARSVVTDTTPAVSPVRTRYSSSAHKAFYNSRAWKLARLDYITLHPVCERCNRAPTTEVHHKQSLERAWELRLEPSNFEGACKPCHSGETVKECGGFGRTPAASSGFHRRRKR